LVTDKKRASYLSNGSSENGSINQGILELIAQFGYVSFEEVMYGFGLSEKESRNHLYYMVQLGLIQTFPSHAQPRYFYCMDKAGFSEVRSKDIAMEVDYFNKKTYRPFSQNHDRMLVRIHCAFKKLFGPDLESWVSEKKIRRDVCFKSILTAHKELRVLDGLFLAQMHKKRFTRNSEGQLQFYDNTTGPWWTGLELELTMKSKARYKKQFSVLSEFLYDRIEKNQWISQMLFLCGDASIEEALIRHQQEYVERYGQCVFVFGQAETFLKDPKGVPLLRILREDQREIRGEDLNRIKLKVTL